MAIYFMHYNFVRIHRTLKTPPAMAAGVTTELWEMSDTLTDTRLHAYPWKIFGLKNAVSRANLSLVEASIWRISA